MINHELINKMGRMSLVKRFDERLDKPVNHVYKKCVGSGVYFMSRVLLLKCLTFQSALLY